MKPEPLTKEKIDEKIIWDRFWSIIRRLPIMKMKRQHDNEVIGLQIAFEGEILHIQRDVKSAVQGLLKEIEKEKKFSESNAFLKQKQKDAYFLGYLHALDFCEEKIKKWFSDVVENGV